MANGRTGQIFLEDFDVGLAQTIGAELINIELDGEETQVFALQVDEVSGPDEYQGLVPVIMSDPDDSYGEQFLPQVVIQRGTITPAMSRWFPGGHEYLIPAANADTVEASDGRSGPNRMERKPWSWPFDISYDLHIRARYRVQADRIFKRVGRVIWAYGQIFLTDSEGEDRGYYAFVESNDALQELNDIADRMLGYTISMRVEGELDFVEPVVLPAQYKIKTSLHEK